MENPRLSSKFETLNVMLVSNICNNAEQLREWQYHSGENQDCGKIILCHLQGFLWKKAD